ncbi:ABC transporter permease [Diplocloster hominis]|uniref:ABC transporter permease n=1 Tax=Diplocloster hominis TaxID=3079010 RepID=UPI0031BB8274
MRAAGRQIMAGLLLAAVLICLTYTLDTASRLKTLPQTVVFDLREKPLTQQEIDNLREAENKREMPVLFTAWSQRKGTLAYPELNRETTADLVYINGDSNLLTAGTNILTEDMKNGCLLSEDLALDLFGSTQVIGEKIKTDDESEYTVQGILTEGESLTGGEKLAGGGKSAGGEKLAVLQADKNITADQISAAAGEEQTDENASEFAMRLGLDDEMVPMQKYSDLAGAAISLLLVLIGGSMILPWLAELIRCRKQPFAAVFCLGLILLISLIFGKVSGIELKIPESMIPTRWSDFEFWGEWYRRSVKSWKSFLYVQKTGIQAVYADCAAAVVVGSLLTGICYLLWRKVCRPETLRSFYLWLLTTVILEFIVMIRMGNATLQQTDSRMIWLLLPLCFTTAFVRGQLTGKLTSPESHPKLENKSGAAAGSVEDT